MRFVIAAVSVLLLMPALAAQADCGCGSTDSANVCTGTTTGNYSVASRTFKFDFNCNGGACACGQFINGEYWVAPINAQGASTGNVTVTSVSNGGNGGLELNTPGGDNNLKQSLLPDESYYERALNVRNSLPLSVNPSSGPQSLITADVGPSNCPNGVFTSCVRRATVLTVLPSIPEKAGSETFRPPWAGNNKPLYTWDQVRTDILPSHQTISSKQKEASADLPSIQRNFSGALYDKCGLLSALVRMCLSEFASDGSDFSEKTHGAILTLLGAESIGQKRPALISFLQHGIDRYGLWKIGNFFTAGAGQNVGRYAPLAFAATLIDDPQLKADVRDIGTRGENGPDSGGLPWFRGHQEFDLFGHIRISTRTSAPGSEHFTGGVLAAHTPNPFGTTKKCGSESLYWRLTRDGGGDKDCGSWYGYIDMGPKGIPQSYMNCCWTNPAAALVTAMWAFPQLRLQVNYEPFITYIDRYKGTLPNSNHKGAWAHGPCANREPSPHRADGDCDRISSVNSLDARAHASDHGQPIATTGNLVSPEPETFPIFRFCEEAPSTPGCGDYQSPYCGDSVCDSRGIYTLETQSSCPQDCAGVLSAGTTPPFVYP